MNVWQFCSFFFPPMIGSFLEHGVLETFVKTSLASIPALQKHTTKLLVELPIYLGAIKLYDPGLCDIASFWNKCEKLLPTWFECFKFVAVLQPSSIATERFFAQLRRSVKDHEKSASQEQKAGSTIVRYNKIQRDRERERTEQLQIELQCPLVLNGVSTL